MALLKSFRKDRSGQGTTEYAVIIGLVSLTLLLFLVAFRTEVGRVYRMVRLELMENATEQVGATAATGDTGGGEVGGPPGDKGKPGLGQGKGCPSVGGCKDGGGRK